MHETLTSENTLCHCSKYVQYNIFYGFKIHIRAAKSSSVKTYYALYVFFSDLNKSRVPMTDDNGSYVSVVGKCNIALLLLWKWSAGVMIK